MLKTQFFALSVMFTFPIMGLMLPEVAISKPDFVTRPNLSDQELVEILNTKAKEVSWGLAHNLLARSKNQNVVMSSEVEGFFSIGDRGLSKTLTAREQREFIAFARKYEGRIRSIVQEKLQTATNATYKKLVSDNVPILLRSFRWEDPRILGVLTGTLVFGFPPDFQEVLGGSKGRLLAKVSGTQEYSPDIIHRNLPAYVKEFEAFVDPQAPTNDEAKERRTRFFGHLYRFKAATIASIGWSSSVQDPQIADRLFHEIESDTNSSLAEWTRSSQILEGIDLQALAFWAISDFLVGTGQIEHLLWYAQVNWVNQDLKLAGVHFARAAVRRFPELARSETFLDRVVGLVTSICCINDVRHEIVQTAEAIFGSTNVLPEKTKFSMLEYLETYRAHDEVLRLFARILVRQSKGDSPLRDKLSRILKNKSIHVASRLAVLEALRPTNARDYAAFEDELLAPKSQEWEKQLAFETFARMSFQSPKLVSAALRALQREFEPLTEAAKRYLAQCDPNKLSRSAGEFALALKDPDSTKAKIVLDIVSSWRNTPKSIALALASKHPTGRKADCSAPLGIKH